MGALISSARRCCFGDLAARAAVDQHSRAHSSGDRRARCSRRSACRARARSACGPRARDRCPARSRRAATRHGPARRRADLAAERRVDAEDRLARATVLPGADQARQPRISPRRTRKSDLRGPGRRSSRDPSTVAARPPSAALSAGCRATCRSRPIISRIIAACVSSVSRQLADRRARRAARPRGRRTPSPRPDDGRCR